MKLDEVIPPDRPDNLFEPPPGDPGSHGVSDGQAHARSVQHELNRRRRTLAAAGAAAAVALGRRG